VRVSNIDEAIAFWKGLLEYGVYVNLVTPPATPDGGCLLRCSVSAGHSPEQIEQIGNAFASIKEVIPMAETAYNNLLFLLFERFALIGFSKPGASHPVSPATIGALRAPVFSRLWRKNPSHPLCGWSLTQIPEKF
jgi:hypothetical protein